MPNTTANIVENVIDEQAEMSTLSPDELDRILYSGWRLLGRRFVRHNFTLWNGALCHTIPLRVRLAAFEPSKSQRRVLQHNTDLRVLSAPARFDAEREHLFDLHYQRFQEKQSTSLASFLHPHSPHALPTEGRELAVYLENQFIACSFFHLGRKAVSGTYCVFDPAYSKRSLGTLTMLLEMLLCKEMGMEYYYHGYTNDRPSSFDYKLNFAGIEAMNWETGEWAGWSR